MNRASRSAPLDGLCFVVLTILVWGVNALKRGMWQDDAQALGEAFHRASHSLRALLDPFPSALRRLTLLPSAIANAMPQPVWTLQILCAAVWLAHGLLAGWIAGLLLPGRRWTRFVVVCLTLTATSDLTTGSMVALAYNVAALFLLAAVGWALIWLGRGQIIALAASAILLAISLLTMEVALPAVPFLALLFVWFAAWSGGTRLRAMMTQDLSATSASGRAGPGVAGLLVAWGIVLIPAGIVEWSFLRDPTSYAAMALVPVSKSVYVTRTIWLWSGNFAPWRWAFARPEWYVRPVPVIPAIWMAAGSLFAAALFLLRLRTIPGDCDDGRDDDATPENGLSSIRLAVFFAVMALAANAAYALVWFSELTYRTHILSRIWASLAIGIFAGWAAARSRPWRWAALAIVTVFIFFGTWGGIERQDFFLASWREHQRELASILNAAPSLRPGTAVILRGAAPPGRYLATEAGYLTKQWLRLLYSEPNIRTMRFDPRRRTGCQSSPAGLECWLEGQAGCFANKTCQPTRFRYEELVMMDYDSGSGTWHLVRSLRDDPLARGYESEAARYRPENRIVMKPWTVRQRHLLLRDK